MQSDNTGHVSRRKVFYIPGYDPFPPRKYREIYRREGAAQSMLSGHILELDTTGDRTGCEWRVKAKIEGNDVQVEYKVLAWSDIVRESMSTDIISTYLMLIRTTWHYISTGSLYSLMLLRKGPIITTIYPFVILLAQLLVSIGIAFLLFYVFSLALPQPFPWVALGIPWTILRWFKSKDGYFYAYYLIHTFAFSARWSGAYPDALESRIKAFTSQLSGSLTNDIDEILLVGHSLGVQVAVSVMADLLRSRNSYPEKPFISLLSIGQVVPMSSFLPQARRLRADLAYISSSTRITWVDITAPADGCCFSLCDPVAVTGVAPVDQRWPLVISAAYSKSLLPKTWAKLRWQFYRLHFQYLHAFDNAAETDFDYFRITAGPLSLAARYAGRAPSKSRIIRITSPFTSIA